MKRENTVGEKKEKRWAEKYLFRISLDDISQ